MTDRAAILIRALRLEAENQALYAALHGDWKSLITALRERGLYWREIGARLGVSANAVRKRYLKATR